jgi:hypothetical protein
MKSIIRRQLLGLPVGWPKKVTPSGRQLKGLTGMIGKASLMKLPVSANELSKLNMEVRGFCG